MSIENRQPSARVNPTPLMPVTYHVTRLQAVWERETCEIHVPAEIPEDEREDYVRSKLDDATTPRHLDITNSVDGISTEIEMRPVEPQIVYLTNACGERTGYGSKAVTDAELAGVPFEEGPGIVLAYLAEIFGATFVLGNLEVAFKHECWEGHSDGLDTQSEIRAYCEAVCEFIRPRLSGGALLFPLNEGDAGRIIVQVAVPHVTPDDKTATWLRLAQVFGTAADHAAVHDLTDYPSL